MTKLGNVGETSTRHSQRLSLFFAKSRKAVEKAIFQTKNRGNERGDPRQVVGMAQHAPCMTRPSLQAGSHLGVHARAAKSEF